MNTRFTPIELADKILEIAISNAHKPDAKDSYKILKELGITKKITGCLIGSEHLLMSGIEEKFQTPLALAINASYPGLIRSATITNVITYDEVTYNLKPKIFEQKLLPDIEAMFKPAPEKKSSAVSNYFTTLFTRKSPSSKTEVTTSILLSKAPAV